MKEYNTDFLRRAHKKSSCHKTEIMRSKICGCYYCCTTFAPEEISEWILENENGDETAICPKCGIDSVLDSSLPIENKNFLNKMNKFWF